MSLPKPYYQDESCTIYHADCREILPYLQRVDLVLTDPPYGLGTILHGGSWGTKGESWDFQRPDITEIIERADFSCVWGGNYFSLPVSRGWLVWYKPDANGHIGKAELAWTNKDMPIQHISFSIAATNKERNSHPTLKPLAVIKWALSFFNSDTILDPFMGSGTTLVAAKQLGRKAIGIEIEEKYVKIAIDRLRQEVLPLNQPSHEKQEQGELC